MNSEFVPSAEVEKQRGAWFKQRAKPGMKMDKFSRLNEEALHLFPPTEEERRLKRESLEDVPEFVL